MAPRVPSTLSDWTGFQNAESEQKKRLAAAQKERGEPKEEPEPREVKYLETWRHSKIDEQGQRRITKTEKEVNDMGSDKPTAGGSDGDPKGRKA